VLATERWFAEYDLEGVAFDKTSDGRFLAVEAIKFLHGSGISRTQRASE
jgi:hypothetical protein